MDIVTSAEVCLSYVLSHLCDSVQLLTHTDVCVYVD